MLNLGFICDSGLKGWQTTLHENYDEDFETFESCCETYGIHTRLGFATPEDAWAKNPIIQGSVLPSDLRVSDAQK